MTGAEEFQSKMAALQSKFVARAKTEHSELIELAEKAVEPAARIRMTTIAHGLAGAAGVFGMGPLSLAAQALEEALLADTPEHEIKLAVEALAASLSISVPSCECSSAPSPTTPRG